MTEESHNNRKTLSLKNRRDKSTQSRHSLLSPQRDPHTLQPWQQRLRELEHERQQLQEKIDHIQNRLTFGYSEPLAEQCQELKKENLKISCQITDVLVDNM